MAFDSLLFPISSFLSLSKRDSVVERGVLCREKKLSCRVLCELLFGQQLLDSFLSLPIWGFERKIIRNFRAQEKKSSKTEKKVNKKKHEVDVKRARSQVQAI